VYYYGERQVTEMTTHKRGQITIDGLVVPDVEEIMDSMQKWIDCGGIYNVPNGAHYAING